MSNFPLDLATWKQGLQVDEFIAGMSNHQSAMRSRLDVVRLTPAERNIFLHMQRPMYMSVVTEEWCSDCLMNLPILVRIARAAPLMEMRIFIRKDWPELRAYYTELDIPSIPVATFFDENFEIIGHWVERPAGAHERLAAWKAAHPEIEEIRKRADISSEEKKELLREINRELLGEMEAWYNEGLQSETVHEVAQLLQPYLLEKNV